MYGQDRDGYYRVVLSNNRQRDYVKIHTLVAEQFIGDINPPYVVNHKDGNKHNNTVDNLEIITAIENTKHAWETGLSRKELNPNRVHIDVFDHDNNTTLHFGSIEDVKQALNIGWRYINRVRNKEVVFGDCLFKKIIKEECPKGYYVECYHNGLLYRIFDSVKDAAKHFGKPSNSVSGAFKSKYPQKLNRYTLTFPNVSTIENAA